jgi:type I restriction enzyme R subunit
LQKDREAADISTVMMELQKMVDQHIDVVPLDAVLEPEPYDISKIDFDRLRREFERVKNKNTTVQSLKEAVEKRLAQLLRQNPLRTDFQEHYEQLVRAYNKEKDRLAIEQTFDALLNIVQGLNEEEHRAVTEGLDEESLALYDLLKKDNLKKKEIDKVKKVVKSLLEKVKAEIANIDNWQDKESTRDTIRSDIHHFLYDDKTGLPSDYDPDEIELLSDRVYRHIYRAYPSLPSPIYS